ncbi:MAG: amidinotransferase [Armatimonadetes bacterium]|nr:amidinotransferase [Armatimonadota bacterium]
MDPTHQSDPGRRTQGESLRAQTFVGGWEAGDGPAPTSRVLMIRPASFGFNPETAASNTFQQNTHDVNASDTARQEFDQAVITLTQAGVQVEVIEDTSEPPKPDAVFPNNWVSFHPGGRAILYPMANPSRQAEVRPEILQQLGYQVALDLRQVAHGKALEGTGSLVFDHQDKLAYACISPRTDHDLAQLVCEQIGYRLVAFKATHQGQPIYHTNVLMAVGEDLIVICKEVCESLPELHKPVLKISRAQMCAFAGNMLQLRSTSGENLWVMSETAWTSLTPDQQRQLEQSGKPVAIRIPTIETLGGGSARCMIAELF